MAVGVGRQPPPKENGSRILMPTKERWGLRLQEMLTKEGAKLM